MTGTVHPVDALADFRITIYASLSGLVFLLYDHLISLDDEIEYVWKARMTLPKFLFLFTRYLVPVASCICMHAYSGISRMEFSDTFCKVWTSISILLGVLSMASSNFIILLRVWVLWERRVALVISTLILCILCQLATLGMAIWYITQAIPHIIYMKSPNIMACALIDRINFVGLWAPGVCFEVVVFITTCWNAFDRPRAYDQGLHKALYRDGALYFVVLLALRAVNMVIAIVAPLALSILGVYFVWCTTTVTVCRFVLNLRRIAETQESTDPDGTLPCADDEILKDNPSPAFEEYEMH